MVCVHDYFNSEHFVSQVVTWIYHFTYTHEGKFAMWNWEHKGKKIALAIIILVCRVSIIEVLNFRLLQWEQLDSLTANTMRLVYLLRACPWIFYRQLRYEPEIFSILFKVQWNLVFLQFVCFNKAILKNGGGKLDIHQVVTWIYHFTYTHEGKFAMWNWEQQRKKIALAILILVCRVSIIEVLNFRLLCSRVTSSEHVLGYTTGSSDMNQRYFQYNQEVMIRLGLDRA